MDPQTESVQKAWELREEGRPIEAMAIWQGVYYSYVADKNWERAISSLIDIAICWKIQGEITGKKIYFESAHATLLHIKHVAQTNSVELRNDYSYHLAGVETALGIYENAIANYEVYLSSSKTQEEEANILAHVGFAKAQHGQKEEGIDLLRKSLGMFAEAEERSHFENKRIFRIWKVGAMIRLAQLLEVTEAKEILIRALEESREYKLGSRAKQAEKLLEKLS